MLALHVCSFSVNKSTLLSRYKGIFNKFYKYTLKTVDKNFVFMI